MTDFHFEPKGLREISDSLAQDTKDAMTTADLESHYELCLELKELAAQPSTVDWGKSLPADLPRLAETRDSIQACIRSIDTIRAEAAVLSNRLLRGVVRNAVAHAALGTSAAPYDFSAVADLNTVLDEPLEELRTLFANATSQLRGRASRPPHPEWHAHAAQRCKQWWRDELAEPEVRFARMAGRGKARWTPESEFSHWFCVLMKELFGLEVATCRTALHKVAPTRSPDVAGGAAG